VMAQASAMRRMKAVMITDYFADANGLTKQFERRAGERRDPTSAGGAPRFATGANTPR